MTDTFTSTLLDALAPLLTPDTDPHGDHQAFLTALAAMLEPIYGLAMDQGFPDDPDWVPGWSTLLDVDACPTAFLPFLAQFVGAVIPAGSDDPTSRSIVRNEPGQKRGQGFGGTYTSATVPAGGSMVIAAQRNLTGSQTLIFQERTAADGTMDPYHCIVGFLTAECPNEAQLIADVEAQKPGGIQVTYISSAGGFTWSEAIHTFSADTAPWTTYFSTQP